MKNKRGEGRQNKNGGVVELQVRELELWKTLAQRLARNRLEHRVKASWGWE